MTSYRVTAPLLVVPDQLGHHHHRYRGQLINWPMPDENREHLLEHGWIEELAPPPGVAPADDPVDVAPAAVAAPEGVPERPNQVATKDIWVDYAVRALGIDPAAAEAMTKNDLIALPAQ